MNDGRVVSNFILQALKNETVTVCSFVKLIEQTYFNPIIFEFILQTFQIYGSGKQTRSFQYVSDLVDGLIKLMASNFSDPVNLGNPVERTIQDFALIIKNLVGGNSLIKQTLAVEDDPQRRRPDISRAKKYLNWEPQV